MSLPCRRLGIPNILPVPVLVQSVYGLDNELDRLQRKLERSGCSKGRKEKVQKKLDLARVDFKEALGAPEVIRKFLPTSVRKLLVFCRDLTDLKQMVPRSMRMAHASGTCHYSVRDPSCPR